MKNRIMTREEFLKRAGADCPFCHNNLDESGSAFCSFDTESGGVLQNVTCGHCLGRFVLAYTLENALPSTYPEGWSGPEPYELPPAASVITQIEVDRASIKLKNGSQEAYGVYKRKADGTADWAEDLTTLDEALTYARELADEHACPILDSTSTGAYRSVEERT